MLAAGERSQVLMSRLLKWRLPGALTSALFILVACDADDPAAHIDVGSVGFPWQVIVIVGFVIFSAVGALYSAGEKAAKDATERRKDLNETRAATMKAVAQEAQARAREAEARARVTEAAAADFGSGGVQIQCPHCGTANRVQAGKVHASIVCGKCKSVLIGSTAGGPKNPYDVLGIKHGASRSEVDAAYRRLAQIYHPDRFVGMADDVRLEAAARMKNVNWARQKIASSE